MPGKRTRILCVTTFMLAGFCAAAILNFHDSSVRAQSTSTAKSGAKNGESPHQLYELRVYTAAPGKMDSLHRRFRDHTLRLFEKHGIKSVGYWTSTNDQKQECLYYIVAYPDEASRDKMLIKGIAADPEFRQVVAESEKDGKLTTKIDSVLLTPTDYSALK